MSASAELVHLAVSSSSSSVFSVWPCRPRAYEKTFLRLDGGSLSLQPVVLVTLEATAGLTVAACLGVAWDGGSLTIAMCLVKAACASSVTAMVAV